MVGWVIEGSRRFRSQLSLCENKNAVVNIFLPAINIVPEKKQAQIETKYLHGKALLTATFRNTDTLSVYDEQ
jgi:hypothetical protein